MRDVEAIEVSMDWPNGKTTVSRAPLAIETADGLRGLALTDDADLHQLVADWCSVDREELTDVRYDKNSATVSAKFKRPEPEPISVGAIAL